MIGKLWNTTVAVCPWAAATCWAAAACPRSDAHQPSTKKVRAGVPPTARTRMTRAIRPGGFVGDAVAATGARDARSARPGHGLP